MASSDASQLAGAPAPGSVHTTGAATQRLAGSGSAGSAGATGDGTHLPAEEIFSANAALIMEILNDEAKQHAIPAAGRADGGWCHQLFLRNVSGAGDESWKTFKINYSRRIDHSRDWQWVRVGQGKEIAVTNSTCECFE